MISELISLSVVSECTFYAVLDSFSTRGHGKNCPVKIFEVYVEILGVLCFGPNSSGGDQRAGKRGATSSKSH